MTVSSVSGLRRRVGGVGAGLLAAGLACCSGLNDGAVTSALVTPGKYEFHSCQDIQNGIRGRRARLAELETLMARASQGLGGEFVNAIAYRSEYLQNRGEIDALVKATEAKQCTVRSPWSSERAVF